MKTHHFKKFEKCKQRRRVIFRSIILGCLIVTYLFYLYILCK